MHTKPVSKKQKHLPHPYIVLLGYLCHTEEHSALDGPCIIGVGNTQQKSSPGPCLNAVSPVPGGSQYTGALLLLACAC